MLLVALGLLPVGDAIAGMRKGIDVYLFLIGMMLIAELARREGLFDWMAALAVEHAQGSPQRLFLLVYVVGTVVTVLLSVKQKVVANFAFRTGELNDAAITEIVRSVPKIVSVKK